jgi:8-oxo-dGTP diphosphatase
MSTEELVPEQVVVAQHEEVEALPLPLPDITPTDDVPAATEDNDTVLEDAKDDIPVDAENNDPTTPARKKGTEIPPEHRGAIYQRYLNGESMGNIAKSEGLSKSTIQHVVRKVKETGSTQTKPRCGRPLKQGELSRTTLRRRKLKGLLVENGETPGTDSPTSQLQLPLDPNNSVDAIAYPITNTLAGASRRAGAATNEFPLPPEPPAATVVCSDIYGINHAVPTSELQWRPAAYAIVIKNTSILLLKQHGGAYDLPGGGVKLGEDPQQAVIRECKEETGINATTPTILGSESTFFRASHSDNMSYHSILMYYACKYTGGKLSTKGLDAHEKQYVEGAEWVKLSALEGIKVSSTVDFRPYVQKATAKPQ